MHARGMELRDTLPRLLDLTTLSGRRLAFQIQLALRRLA
jgi:hypothetical protein